MRASAADAIAAARRDTACTPGMCLAYVVKWWQAPSIGCPDAATSWAWALDKHPGDRNPPPGAPIFYSGGKHGHIALALGAGAALDIRSTDCGQTGYVGESDLDWPTRAWGYPYLGWTGDLSKVMLPLTTGGGDDDVKPTDVVGKDSDGTDLTMAELAARMNWLYQQWLDSGVFNKQLDRIEKQTK